jgi:hypothetical protein
MATTKKLKSFKHNEPPASQMVMRMVEVRREQANAETKSVPVVIASENPVERWDDNAGEYYREILSMDGVRFRTNRQQLPIVDSHDRSTVRNVLGSVRNIRTENDKLVGDATFARDTDSQVAYEKLLDGHLTDFSITATPTAQRAIRRGESVVHGTQEITGPAVIVTEWTPTDASLVAAGADETSTVRELLRSYSNSHKETKRMLSEGIKAALVAKGMPEQIDDAEQALAWAAGLMSALTPSVAVEEPIQSAEETPVVAEESDAEEPEAEEIENMEGEKDMKEEIEKAVKRSAKAELQRQKEIRAIVESVKIGRAFADELCDSGVTLDIARQKVLERMTTTQPLGSGPSVVREGREELRKAMRAGLISRALQGSGARNVQIADADKVAGYQDFERMSMLRMVERSLQAAGLDTSRMVPKDMTMLAFGHRPTIERLQNANIIRDAYHTTGSFANLLLDAANKTLLAGYEEAPYTWNLWARQAASVADFKNINRIRFGESPNLEMVPENTDYKEGAMTDSKETYKVEKFGRLFTITWETVVNDDLDAISRIPQMHGNAARRTQNQKVYEVLTSNPTMGDGVALFGSHASGSNTSGGAGAPAVGTLNTGFTAMRRQTGLNSSTILNIAPRYLIVPVSYEATALELVNSTSYNAANNNEGVRNIYGPGGPRSLTVIGEPQLDASSTTVWYLAADPGQIDTVELTFLQGEESPVIESEWDFDKDVYKNKVRQTFGVKAIDWRGLFRNSA